VTFFNDIRSKWSRMIYPAGMISAAQMIYASRMKGTDNISYIVENPCVLRYNQFNKLEFVGM